MSIDLSYSPEARELAAAVRTMCSRAEASSAGTGVSEPAAFSPERWSELAGLGVLGLTGAGGGSADVLAATGIELGRAGVRGPLVAALVGGRALGPAYADRIATGLAIVSMGVPPLMPWAPLAETFIEIDGATAYRAHVTGPIDTVETLAGEPWGRCALERDEELAAWPEAATLGEIVAAAYLRGAGQRLLDAAVTYAAQRTQFGRAIGDFQATAHPLANCHLRLAAADTLVRLAAHAFDTGDAGQRSQAVTARQSAAAAATETAYRAHQTLGAMGFTVEGPIGGLSQQIRQTAAIAAMLTDTTAAVLAPYGL